MGVRKDEDERMRCAGRNRQWVFEKKRMSERGPQPKCGIQAKTLAPTGLYLSMIFVFLALLISVLSFTVCAI